MLVTPVTHFVDLYKVRWIREAIGQPVPLGAGPARRKKPAEWRTLAAWFRTGNASGFQNRGGHLMQIPIIILGFAGAAGSSAYDYVTFAD